MNKEFIADQFRNLQDYICERLEILDDGEKFKEDLWTRSEGGGGRTRTISKGKIIEKGGVAFSEVYGEVTPTMKSQLGLEGESFFASGVSIVLHSNHPFIPIIHMNVRYFELNTGAYWFGGGIDLTPHYIVPELAGEFHRSLKNHCDNYNSGFYAEFKNWADDYFYIPHRNETRGVGGIFFDHLDESCGLKKNELLKFCLELGELFPEVYRYQVENGRFKTFTEENIKWRNLRRGRYVEFNLVHDKGTKFGLFSGGRTESILMSLPPDASWEYNFHPQPLSEEFKTLESLSKGIDWVVN